MTLRWYQARIKQQSTGMIFDTTKYVTATSKEWDFNKKWGWYYSHIIHNMINMLRLRPKPDLSGFALYSKSRTFSDHRGAYKWSAFHTDWLSHYFGGFQWPLSLPLLRYVLEGEQPKQLLLHLLPKSAVLSICVGRLLAHLICDIPSLWRLVILFLSPLREYV